SSAAAAQSDGGENRSTPPVPSPSSATRIAPPPPQIELNAGPALPEITFGANVRVNRDPGTASGPQVEPSVASNPADSLDLVAGFADALNGPVVFDFAPGVARSADGGHTWSLATGGPRLQDPPGFICGSVQ